jgi:uncharacterized membrane protein
MIRYVAAYIVTLVVMLAIDAVWLSLTAGPLYKATLGDIFAPQYTIAPAIAFYLIYVAGIVVFATTPAIQSNDWSRALVYGALFGFFGYAVYDLTNWVTLRNWTWVITAADLTWGTVLTGVSATLGFVLSRALLAALKLA